MGQSAQSMVRSNMHTFFKTSSGEPLKHQKITDTVSMTGLRVFCNLLMLHHVHVDMQAIYLTVTSERKFYISFLRKTKAEEEAASTYSMIEACGCGQ